MANITGIIQKYWNILYVNKELYGLFEEGPITSFKRNKNLEGLTGSTCTGKGKVKKLSNTDMNGKCFLCISETKDICYTQVISTTNLKSQQTERVLQIFENVNCKSQCVIYLIECNNAQ